MDSNCATIITTTTMMSDSIDSCRVESKRREFLYLADREKSRI